MIAKINLYSIQETQIDIDTLSEGEDYNSTITCSDFEKICKEDFYKIIQ